MDKNMIFFGSKIWIYFRKESLCHCGFSMLYFVCENTRDMEHPFQLPLNEFTEEKFE